MDLPVPGRSRRAVQLDLPRRIRRPPLESRKNPLDSPEELLRIHRSGKTPEVPALLPASLRQGHPSHLPHPQLHRLAEDHIQKTGEPDSSSDKLPVGKHRRIVAVNIGQGVRPDDVIGNKALDGILMDPTEHIAIHRDSLDLLPGKVPGQMVAVLARTPVVDTVPIGNMVPDAVEQNFLASTHIDPVIGRTEVVDDMARAMDVRHEMRQPRQIKRNRRIRKVAVATILHLIDSLADAHHGIALLADAAVIVVTI